MTIVDRRYSVAEGTAVKAPCRAATTANITLSGEQTIDGVAVVDGDRVLVKNQSTASQNGIYSCSTGNWTRTRDFDGAYDIVTGTRVFVTSGTANGRTEWAVTTSDPITIDSTNITFATITALGTPFADGTVAAPGAAFASAPSWGLYKTANGVGIAVNGVLVLEIKPGQIITTALLQDDSVTLAKLVNATAQNKILARKTASSGDWEECTLSDILDMVTSAAQGDILYRGASSWTRLPAGTSGYSLITGGAGQNPSWGRPGLISAQTANSSTALTFTGINSTYRKYVFDFDNIIPATNLVTFISEVSDDGGSSWKATSYLNTAFVNNNSGGSAVVSLNTAFSISNISDVGNNSGYGLGGSLSLHAPSNTTNRKNANWQVSYKNSVASGVSSVYGGGAWDGVTALTAIRFRFSSGNIASGTITAYGVTG